MTIQTTGRGTEEDITKTSHYQRRRGVQGGENPEQKNGAGKREIPGMVEGVYGGRRHMGK